LVVLSVSPGDLHESTARPKCTTRNYEIWTFAIKESSFTWNMGPNLQPMEPLEESLVCLILECTCSDAPELGWVHAGALWSSLCHLSLACAWHCTAIGPLRVESAAWLLHVMLRASPALRAWMGTSKGAFSSCPFIGATVDAAWAWRGAKSAASSGVRAEG